MKENVYGVELKTRTEKVKIAKVIDFIEDYSAGFPGLVFEDDKGRQRTIAALDISNPTNEFNRIKSGSIIEITIMEVIRGASIISDNE